MTNQQKAAALHLSVALGCLDTVKHMEQPKSARHNRLSGAEDATSRCVDMYRLESFSTADLNNAAEIIDLVNAKIAEFYP